MRKVLNFAFVITSLDAGGIENYLLRFLTHYSSDFKSYVICKGGRFGELEEKYRALPDVELIVLPIGFINPSSWYRLYQFLRKNQISTICDFTGNFAGISLMVAKLASVNTRLAFFRSSGNRFKETFLKGHYNRLMNLLVKMYATRILSNSQSALDNFFPKINIDKYKLQVIYNGINAIQFSKEMGPSLISPSIREELGIPKDAFVIGHTGRYNEAKNHATILKVAEKVCEKHENVVFVLCGKNTDMALKDCINKSSILKEKVIALGYRKDVFKVLKCFDLFFFPSITEGQPNALIEALVVGLPVIASNINPIKETVPEEMEDLLFDPFDVIGFSNKISEIYSQKVNLPNYSEWATQKYNHQVLFKRFRDVLYVN